METWIDIVAAVMGWGLTAYLGIGVYRSRQGQLENAGKSGAVDTWLFALCLTIYFTLRVEAVANTVDAFLIWNNVARFLAYLSVIWAAYFLNQVLSRLVGAVLPKWHRVLPFMACTALFVIYITGVAQSASGEGESPVTFADLLFREVLYVYMFTLLLAPIPTHLDLLRAETAFLGRIRISLSMLAVGSAAALAGVKAVTGMIAYVNPSAESLPVLDSWATLLKALIPLAFAMKFLPSKFYRVLLRPILVAHDLLLLRDLKVVEHQVHRFCMPLVQESPTFWQVIRAPDYYIHRSLIQILDGQKKLDGYLGLERDLPQSVPAQDSPLNKLSFEEVARFYQQLSSIEADGTYEDLLHEYRELGRLMRKNGSGYASIQW